MTNIPSILPQRHATAVYGNRLTRHRIGMERPSRDTGKANAGYRDRRKRVWLSATRHLDGRTTVSGLSGWRSCVEFCGSHLPSHSAQFTLLPR